FGAERAEGGDDGGGRVGDQLVQRAGDDQGREGTQVAQVGAGLPDLGQRAFGGYPDARRARFERAGEGRVAAGEEFGGDGVGVRAAEHDADVRQVGVHVEPAVPGAGGGGGGGGDPCPGQRGDELAGRVRGAGDHDLGDADRPRARRAEVHPGG